MRKNRIKLSNEQRENFKLYLQKWSDEDSEKDWSEEKKAGWEKLKRRLGIKENLSKM